MNTTKKSLIEREAALTPKQAATILGCQPEQVRDYVPGWRVNDRWKFRTSAVLAARDRMERREMSMERRNNGMVRRAGR